MRRRYPEYRGGGMPPDMPTDIQRLIRRMLEARTDKAEDVIPDMASGGILGLQNGGSIYETPDFSNIGGVDISGDDYPGVMGARRRARRKALRDYNTLEELYDAYPEAEEYGDIFNPYMSRKIRERMARNPGSGPFGYYGSQKFRDSDEFRDIGSGIAGKFRGGLEALGNRLRSHVRIPGKGPNLSTDEEYLERTSPEGWPKYLDARRRRLEGRASGGIIGFQAGGSPYQQRMVQSYVSPEVAQPYADLTGRIQQVGAQPYTPYGGQRLAATTADQALARGAYGAYGRGAGPAATQQAAATMGQAGQMLGGAYQGVAGLQPQYAQMATQLGGAAQGALGQAQAGAQGMQDLSARAQLQGQLAGAGMRQTGTAAQTEQQALGAGQAAAGQAGQTQMTGLGQQAQQAGQAALGAQQGFGTGMTGMGTAAQQAGQTAQTAMGLTGTQGQTQAQSAAERMRTLGGQAPDLQKGADLSQYMSQYTAGVTDPQLQQLMEFQRMQGQEVGSAAAQSGAYGGARADVEQRKLREQTGQQAAEIIGKGQQQAFESAQQAFQADRAAKQQAQQTGLSAEQQAAATQAGAQGQALAAQQAGIGAAQAGGAQQMQAQQQAAQMADVDAGRQLQGLQAQTGATAQGIGMGQQGLAAQQAAAAQGAQFGLQGQQQGFQAAQAGTQLGLAGLQQAGQLGQQGYGTMGQLLGQQQGAIGAQGQGFGQMGQLGGQMGQLGGQQMQLGQQQQQQQLQRLQAMEQAGARTQQEQQRDYDIAYQDFQKQQQHPQQQINWQLGAMQGLPYQNTQVIGDYGQTPGLASDIAGAISATSANAARTRQDALTGATATHSGTGAVNPDGSPIETPVSDSGLPPIDTGITTDLGPKPDLISGVGPSGTPLTTADPYPTPGSDPYTYDPHDFTNVGGVDISGDDYPGTGIGEQPPIAAGGGYLSSSGILAPYHKKLIDGLYAGGRINY